MAMGKLEEVEWGEGKGIMHINCSLPKENYLACDAEERIQNWKISRNYIFSKLGIVSTRTFHTKKISTKKYYEVINKSIDFILSAGNTQELSVIKYVYEI